MKVYDCITVYRKKRC